MTPNRRTLGLLAAAVAAALAVPSAHAAVVSYAASASTRGDESTRNVLPGFDDALGTLTGASVSLSGTISGRAGNPIATIRPSSVTVSPYLILGGLAAFNLSVEPPALSATPIYTESGGYTLPWSETFDSGPLTMDLAVIGENDVRYTIAGGFNIRPNPGEIYDNGAPFTGTATVVYTYTPADSGGTTVPEPASVALLGLGLAGAAATRRRAV